MKDPDPPPAKLHYLPESDRRAALARQLKPAAHPGRVLVDFDHTLFLWNSTEAFVDSTRPAFYTAILLKVLGALAPWRVFGKRGYFIWRDFFRMILCYLMAPWTGLVFRRRAGDIFREQLNTELDRMLAGTPPEKIVIVSFGFRHVIRTLIAGTRYENATLVAPGLFDSVRYRKAGKVEMLRDAGIMPDPDTDILITDSAVDDADMLAMLPGRGYVIEWPEANTQPAHRSAYVPFFYTARIKRSPGFLIKQVFLEELPVILLTFAVLDMTIGLAVAATLTLLFVAFMLVYEIGYAENDRIGHAREAAPKLSAAFFKYPDFRLEPHAWIWAVGITLLAFAILPASVHADMLERTSLDGIISRDQAVFTLAAVWMGILILARIAFWAFNNASLQWRVFAYLPLHAVKYLGPLVLFAAHPAGIALTLAQITRTWSMYAVRRAGGDELALSSQMVRLVFFILFSAVMLSAVDMQREEMILFGAALVFCFVRAIPEVRRKML
ncbi:MAG: hypothetical protein ACK46Q_10645 [Hyphomonas sp.]